MAKPSEDAAELLNELRGAAISALWIEPRGKTTPIPAKHREAIAQAERDLYPAFNELAQLVRFDPQGVDAIRRLMKAASVLGRGTAFSQDMRELHLAPNKIGGSKGGQKSRLTRQAAVDMKWRAEARNLVLSRWTSSPAKPPQDALANEVKNKILEAPKYAQVISFIRKMKKDGLLLERWHDSR